MMSEIKQPQHHKKPRKERTHASRTVITKSIKLQTECAYKVFERSYENFAQSAYMVELIAPIVCTEEQADIANQEIETIMSTINSELKSEVERMDVLMKNAFINDEAKGSSPRTLVIETDSQYASQYLRMIQMLDTLVMKIDTMWINGEMDRKQRGAGTFQWQQRINKVGGRARQVAQVLQQVMKQRSKDPIPEFAATTRLKKREAVNEAPSIEEMIEQVEEIEA